MISLQAQLTRFVAPLKQKLTLMAGRCIVRLVDDATKLQALQVTTWADITRNKAERFQEYGFTSWPEAGAEGIAVALGGNTGHTVILGVDDRRYRPKGLLAEGDVALYRLTDGILVWLKANGMVELGPSPTQFVALANLTFDEINKVRNTLNALITNYNAFKTAFPNHTHAGVTVGSGSTGITAAIGGAATAPDAVASVAAEKVRAK